MADTIKEIPLEELHPFPDHPFGVRDDDTMQQTVESVREYGVLVPGIARPREGGGYEIIAGHRRKHACELAERKTMPFIIRDIDPNTATYGRMIEIYLVTSVAPIPMATMVSKESGNMGQNYLRSLFALAFQAFLIIVCVAIYAALVENIAVETDISAAIWTCMGYTVLLCFTLFKTGSMAKSIFNAS